MAAVALILSVAALVFTNASTSEDLIDEAGVLQTTEAALGANDLALKAMAQAVLLAEDQMLGVADVATMDAAVAEAARTVAELEGAAAAVQVRISEAGSVQVATQAVVDSANEILALIKGDRIIEAGPLLAGHGRTQFETLRDTLSVIRDQSSANLADADAVTGVLASLARYVLAFLIPAAAILAYRVMARRQLRFAEVELDARLDAEEEVVRAKDEFIANISHELRTPLTSIFGFSELLLEQGVVDPDQAGELIALINTESGELTRLVEDFLPSPSPQADSLTFQLESVSIPDELEAVVLQLNRAGTVATTRCVDVPVLADPLRVRQMLRNLMSNAQRHGGEDIRVSGRVLGGSYLVVIEDDGPGVPSEMEQRLFSRFVHQGEDPLTKGSIGLGLAVVKIIVEGMNGTVRYERADGWTRFIVRLPLAVSVDGSIEGHPEELSDEVA
ncbi:MAG: sensor histidine kinase [Acidimicrobiia bacterium]